MYVSALLMRLLADFSKPVPWQPLPCFLLPPPPPPPPPLINPRADSHLHAIKARSLLTSHEDYTTLMYHSGSEIQKPGAVFAFLKRSLPDGVVEEVQRMTLTTDGRCAVFDVPSKRAQVAVPPGFSLFPPLTWVN